MCRAGDRVLELTSGDSALLPILLRRAVRPRSLTVLHVADAGIPGGTGTGGGGGGHLALSSPIGGTDVPEVLLAAGFTVDEVHGIGPPDEEDQLAQVMLDRFGQGSVALHQTMRLSCEPEFGRPVLGACRAEDAATVLRICRRTGRRAPSIP